MNENNNPNFDFYSFNEQPKKEEPKPAPEADPLVAPTAEPVDWTEQAAQREGEERPEATATAATVAVAVIDPAEQASKMKRSYSRVGWCFVAVTVVWLLSTVILQVIAAIAAPQLYDTYWFEIVTGTVPLYVICTPLLFLLLQGAPTQAPDKKKLPVGHFFLLLVMAEAVMVIGSLIGNGLMTVVSLLSGNDFQNHLNDTFALPLWINFLFAVVLAPIFEEIIFRKLLLDRMLPHGSFCAILFNGILFGAFHGNFFQFFYTAALGMLLAFLYSRTGKLHHCILIHMGVNFIGGVLPSILYDWLDYDAMMQLMDNEEELLLYVTEHILPYLATMAYSALQYGCAVAGVIIFAVNFRHFKSKKGEGLLPVKQGLTAGFVNSGMIAAVVVCIALFAISMMSSVVA